MPKQFPNKSVSSIQEFVQQLQSYGNINEDEVMVSFDVTDLFASVPVNLLRTYF